MRQETQKNTEGGAANRGDGARGKWVKRGAAAALVLGGVLLHGAAWGQGVSCGEETLNCSSKDLVNLSTTVVSSPCVIGTWNPVQITVSGTPQGGNTRYDIGAWFRGQNQCQTRMSTVGTGGFTNQEGANADTCGDLTNGTPGTQTFTVDAYCQPNAMGGLTVPTTLFWTNQNNGATCNSAPATASKCNTVANSAAVTFQGQLTVKKIAAGATAADSFPFTVTSPAGGAATPASFSLANGGSQVVTATVTQAGLEYQVTETPGAGWQLTGVSCSGAASTQAVANGVKVTMSHTNN